ncbi:DUF4403 family protein [Mucilaginibacter sp. HMF5004]|uniref:DUF4403 family protein n=1 Tax=Mucilaginibacter rivuli TaxID=2857527 RepID=UPI001C5EAD8F|nr:DUF4403 family protein [Mucilaginibacter rivuli]
MQPVSNIEIPVSAELKSYFVQAENSVPVKFSDNQQPCQGLRYEYTFTRSPFNITGSNNVVNLKFMGNYGFIASYCAKCGTLFGSGAQCLVPVVSAQCGMGNELPRKMEISYQSTINVLPDFRLQSKTILYPAPKPINRCNVLFGNIDVTDRLISYISTPLNDLGKQVDTKIAAYNIRPTIEQLWKNLTTEFKMGDIGFLNINPQAVRLSSFNLSGSVLNFSVGLSAKPVVTTISSPQPVKPLPNLSTYIPANGFNIYLDLVENYDHLSNMIKQQVVGQTTDIAGKTFIVDDIKVTGIGKQIALQVDFKGSNTGTVYLVGTPTYNNVTHELSFPDLTFDLQSKAWILKAAKWMFSGKITDAIRKKATYNFTKFLTENKGKLQSQLTRDMGNNIRSEVSIKELDIQTIYPTSEKLIIRTLSTGSIKVRMVM